MFVPSTILHDLFPVRGFKIEEDNDYFQRLFTDEKLIPEREKFLEAVDKIWEGMVKSRLVIVNNEDSSET